MDTQFVALVQKAVAQQGKEVLYDPGRFKPLLADATGNEYPRESRLLLYALEAGAAQEIDRAQELPRCKEQQVRRLHEDYSLDQEKAADAVALLALVLRGDGDPAEITGTHDLFRGTKTPGMVQLPEGTFTMGSPESEPGRSKDEAPHQVRVSAFYMGKYAVTQQEYQEILGTNPSYFKGADLPVEQVSWYDAAAYCNQRSLREGFTPAYQGSGDSIILDPAADGYRLPTEAEWEYACRAGTTTAFNTGDNITTDQANYDGNYPYNRNEKGAYQGKTLAVGSFAPNEWGIYDMHGNVWDWCWDWYGAYSTDSQTDPAGPVSGACRVQRGGSWSRGGQYLRSAFRDCGAPSDRSRYLGFRLVRPRA